ncbi:vacuolar protein sorting 33A-like protein [Biscogniauxia marginata]|nr:vacuolar protein sorting 33A-like protein [Biscogniauxia marginata]
MAPHVGFDTEHIRDKARKDLLYHLEGVRGKKNLVIERSLAGPLGVIVKVSTLQDYGVDKFFFLENNNADTTQRNVVFMARGECARHAQSIAEQIKRLQRESQTGHEFHIFWVPRRTLVSDKLLEEAGVLGDVNISELPLYFFPLERDILSLELDDSFRDLFLFKDTTPAFLMAKALMGIQSKHGLFPRVIGKGDNAKRVAELLTRMRQEILAGEDTNDSTKSGLTPSNTIESVIVIDREVDFVTPLLTQLTYEGLIDEVWGIQNNQTDIDSTIVGAPPQQSQGISNTPVANTPSRKRKIQLDSSDKLYDGLRDTNFAIVGTLLNKVARRLQSDYDSRHGSKTTAELKDFVKKLPAYQAEHQSLKIHTGLAEEIMKYTRTDQFSRLLEVQQNLAAGADPSSQYDAIEELIARDMPLSEILRLLCIHSCISGGIKSKDFDHFRRLVLEGYGYQHLLTLHNLEKLQLFLSRSSPMASMIPMPGSGGAAGTKTNYTYLRKQLRLIVDEVNEHDPNDIAYVYSGYAPLSIRLVQCVLQKQYVLSITRGNGVSGTGAAAGGGAQGWRGFEEAVKHARGPAFDELQKGEDKAVKARALLSGGGDKKTVFVVFVGGITFTEIAALRFMAKKEEARRNIVICTTSIISGNKMMDAAIEKSSFTKAAAGALDLHLESIIASPGDLTKTSPSALIKDRFTSHTTDISTSRGTPRTQSEIIVQVDDMCIETDNTASAQPLPDKSTATSSGIALAYSKHEDRSHSGKQPQPGNSHLPGLQENPFESPASALSDHSGLTSPPSTLPPSSKATTPGDIESVKDSPAAPAPAGPTPTKRRSLDVRPRVSIPTDIAPQDYANQCIAAAESSRLNPYALHQDEYLILREHVTHAQVTTYLNIRNGILRLWLNNPRIGVAREEAVGCAKDSRWFDVASVCYDWLVRSGYINFGCAEIPLVKKRSKRIKPDKKGKTIVIIGAGMGGLGCARHLDSLFKQYAARFEELGEEPPRVITLEGRNRLGGRVYSRALDSSRSQHLIGFKGRRHSVECGGMIITGFERGNPLNVLVRGQMGLPYYALRPDTTLYDSSGKAVNEGRDRLVEKLYNDCLERVSDYKFKSPPSKLIEGNKDLMDEGRDSSSEGLKTIANAEEATAALPQSLPVAEQSLGPQVSLVPVSTDRATGRTHVEPGTPATLKAAYKARMMGWTLREGVTEDFDLDLDAAAKAPDATLGSVMDEAISQYKKIVDLTAQDFRLMNWHVANLEYSNATNYHQLSIGGWDIDAGNEWEGKHTMVVGGYQSVVAGLASSPSRLDVRKETIVKEIFYDPDGSGTARVKCENGSTFEADYVVSTIPLGVLKHESVEFHPPLPSTKTEAIGRLGYGILNKIILVYDEVFWDSSKDIFGCLRTPLSRHSLKQSEYASQRGRCFQWFNVSNTSGIPVLLALMAGDAGFDTEHTKNDELVAEATEVLRGVFGAKVPQPIHSIVTRWGSDKFARGSYSSAGPSMQPHDYQEMARPVGNLFFAGEHTTDTHPATVHGAYLSGLRAASEVIDAMLGPIHVPTPLVLPKESASSQAYKRRRSGDGTSPKVSKQARIDAYELEAWQHIVSQIGERPWRPQKVAGNPYLLYSKANFEMARKRCEEGRRPGKGKPSPNEVRVMTSKMWKEATPEERKPFEGQATEQKTMYSDALKQWEEKAKDWDRRYVEVRKEYEKDHKPALDDDETQAYEGGRERRRAKVNSYAESEGSDIEMEDD